jgi:HSP20 family protein
METVFTPFDILFRNFFDRESHFDIINNVKIPHPVDIYENKNGLVFEIACTGLTKKDVEINIEHDILRVTYQRPTITEDTEIEDKSYHAKGIARRSFNLGYKVASRFQLSKADASMENGLLVISIPFAEEAKPKKLSIN